MAFSGESSPDTDARSLRQIFADRKQLIAKYVPPETQAIHAQVWRISRRAISRRRSVRWGESTCIFRTS